MRETALAYGDSIDFLNNKAIGQAALLFALLFPYIEPQIFKTEGYETGDSIFLLLKALSAAFIVLFYAISCKPSKLLFSFGLLQAWLGIATIANHASITTWLGPACGMLMTIMIVEIAIHNGRDCMLAMLSMIRSLLVLYVVINFITFLIFGYGDPAHTSFLGIDNRWIFFYMPLVAISFIIDCMRRGKPSGASWGIWLLCFVHLAIVFSAGAMVALAVFPLLYFFLHTVSKTAGWSIVGRAILVCIVALNVIMVSGLLLNLLAPLIVGYFHKDITLAGRTLLWNVVLETLKMSPVFGHGMYPTGIMQNFFYVSSGYASACRVNHPHNLALYFAMNGGWTALLFFMIAVWLVIKRLDNANSCELKVILLASLTSLLLAALVDSLDFSLIWLLFAISYYCKDIAAEATTNLSNRKVCQQMSH